MNSDHTVEMTDINGNKSIIPETEFMTFDFTYGPTGETLTVFVYGGGQIHFHGAGIKKHIAGIELVGKVDSLPGRRYT